ncbi:MAG: Panacea domain-containing protein, partial [Dehalococcoidia bacterium]|nr:Panacea domain-containing protein [Dehalococcoidia bacterium]
MRKFIFDQIKFRELVLYIANRSQSDPLFGVVKLNKILYYSDFAAYRILGHPITGASYQKFNEGPAPQEMLGQRRVMVDSGDITVRNRPYFSGVQQCIVPLRQADTEMFTHEELSIVDGVIEG